MKILYRHNLRFPPLILAIGCTPRDETIMGNNNSYTESDTVLQEVL